MSVSNSSWDEFSYPHGESFQRKQLQAVESTALRLPHTWKTIEGELIEMAKMNNSHLRNTIQMLRRNSLRRLARRRGVTDVDEVERIVTVQHLGDIDQRASAAWGEVYDELISEALFRSDGDLEEWLQR